MSLGIMTLGQASPPTSVPDSEVETQPARIFVTDKSYIAYPTASIREALTWQGTVFVAGLVVGITVGATLGDIIRGRR